MENNNFYKKHGNIYLNDKQTKILEKYKIDYKKYKNIKELIFDIEYILNNNELNDLEQVSEELSQICYYNYTNK